MSDRIIRHKTLPVSAPESYWRALGWELYTNTDEAGRLPFCDHADRLLAVALAEGLQGEKALAWVVQEEQRRREEQTRATAIARQGEAIGQLALRSWIADHMEGVDKSNLWEGDTQTYLDAADEAIAAARKAQGGGPCSAP